tara:strand:+ start:255 stop:698 length:444 start_codon:yes stop_codon:yes gene_type:complete
MSITIDTFHIRPAQYLLKWNYNPNFSEKYNNLSRTDLEERVGIIPDFFADAITEGFTDIVNVADAMNDEYDMGIGGFNSGFGGSIDSNGVYSSDGDDDLNPLVSLTPNLNAGNVAIGDSIDITCFIYEYGIVGLRDSQGDVRTGRFD